MSSQNTRNTIAFFSKNLSDYHKEINLFVLKVCLAGGILGVLFFCAMKALGILSRLEWSNILKFGILSLINISIPMLFYFLVVRRTDKKILVNIFKYLLITCATVNYYALVSFIPYYEMWSSIFLVFFLSSFYLEINSVLYAIVLSIIVCAIEILTGNKYFMPQDGTYTELLVRSLGFGFGAVCSIITAVLSKKLLMRSSKSEYESNQSYINLKEIIDQATEISNNLSNAGLSISALASQQNKASEEIAQKSSGMLEEVVETARSVEESTVLIDQLVQNIRSSMEKISVMGESSKALQNIANDGKDSIGNAVAKINSIKESVIVSSGSSRELYAKAKEIDSVVEFIRQIADQTNMLALNASIEAARAGENGKGFSVVANEIKQLADKSHESLKIISVTLSEILTHSQKVDELMEESVVNVEEGVEIVKTSDSFYQEIIETLTSTIKMLSEIGQLSESQLTESQSLNKFIQRVSSTASLTSQSVESVAASTEESFAASEELMSTANHINTISVELLNTVKNV